MKIAGWAKCCLNVGWSITCSLIFVHGYTSATVSQMAKADFEKNIHYHCNKRDVLNTEKYNPVTPEVGDKCYANSMETSST